VEDVFTRRAETEAAKTALWGEAMPVLLGTLAAPQGDQFSQGRASWARSCFSPRTRRWRVWRAFLEDARRRGARDRLEILFAALQSLERHLLLPFAADLTEAVARHGEGCHLLRPEFENLPVSEMTILIWVLRAALRSDRESRLDPVSVARNGDVSLSAGACAVDHAGRAALVSWLDDVPEALSLPWRTSPSFSTSTGRRNSCYLRRMWTRHGAQRSANQGPRLPGEPGPRS